MILYYFLTTKKSFLSTIPPDLSIFSFIPVILSLSTLLFITLFLYEINPILGLLLGKEKEENIFFFKFNFFANILLFIILFKFILFPANCCNSAFFLAQFGSQNSCVQSCFLFCNFLQQKQGFELIPSNIILIFTW